jgi:succinate-semialdehyde dehydrogenase
MSDEFNSEAYIAAYMDRARVAFAEIKTWSQERVDLAVKTIAKTVFDHAEELAELAVRETGMGVLQDKVAKNQNKARIIWHDLKGKRSVGVVARHEDTGITEIAKPVGIVVAITPVTNPVVTPMSNAMFAVKGGNAIIITPHHNAATTSARTVELINEALRDIGAPEHLVQILDVHSRENTRLLITAADVVVATGGAGMVKAAYSSGTPALGVGAGNVQCIIDMDADMKTVVPMIVAGRTFDNGIICSGEQSIIAPRSRYDELVKELRANDVAVVEDAPRANAVRGVLFDGNGVLNRHTVGQSVSDIADAAGLDVPENTRMIAVLGERNDILSREKMCPVLVIFTYEDFREAVELAAQNLEMDGKGHSVCIHSGDREHIEYAGLNLDVSRLIVNQSAATSAGGSFFNGLAATNTLGCGSWGGNSISENLTWKHLVNISRIAEYMPNNSVPDDEELWT